MRRHPSDDICLWAEPNDKEVYIINERSAGLILEYRCHHVLRNRAKENAIWLLVRQHRLVNKALAEG